MAFIESIADQAHFVNIKVYTRLGGELVEYISWQQLRWDMRTKWDWYFKYRAALLQVKYPKYYVQLNWGKEDPNEKTLIQIKELKAIAKKRKISEFQNKLQKERESWKGFFPIEEDPVYQQAVFKIQSYNDQLQTMLDEISALKNIQSSKTKNQSYESQF